MEKASIFTPRASDNRSLPWTPATTALASTVESTLTSAVSITLQAGTVVLEVSAVTAGVFLKYAAGVTITSFDEFVVAGTTRHYAVPEGVTVISLIQQAVSAVAIVIEK